MRYQFASKLKWLKLFFWVAIFFSLASGLACSKKGSSLSPKMASTQEYYQNPKVEKTPVFRHVQPKNFPQTPPGALLFPFSLDQDIEYADKLSQSLGGLFYRAWLNLEVFDRLLYLKQTEWPGLQEAVRIGMEKKVDLLVRPRITYFMPGGSQGSSALCVEVKVYSLPKGRMLWYLEQSGRLENFFTQDYIFFIKKSKMPASGEFAIAWNLAQDMGKEIRPWSRGSN